MSLYFKNLRTAINGQSYYAESVDISESIPIETFSALGTKKGLMHFHPINQKALST